MGGSALNGRRVPASEYQQLESQLVDELTDLLHTNILTVPYYSTKPDFGDIDLIVNSDNLPHNWHSTLITHYNLQSDQIQKQNGCTSFLYHGVQVDLILTPERYMQTSVDYFGFNDLGNLLGRLTHKLGIKYGHRGLSIVLRAPNNHSVVLSEIELPTSSSYDTVCEILGLQPRRDFRTLEDMFKFVASSWYFNPDIYHLDNRNSTSRVRDRKRKTYSKFLTWITLAQPTSKYTFEPQRLGYYTKEPYYTEIVLARWPDIKPQVDARIAEYEQYQQYKAVVNGRTVAAITGLDGANLGKFMHIVKRELPVDQVLDNPNSAQASIMQLWKHYSAEFAKVS